jgi:hypothetical protein
VFGFSHDLIDAVFPLPSVGMRLKRHTPETAPFKSKL